MEEQRNRRMLIGAIGGAVQTGERKSGGGGERNREWRVVRVAAIREPRVGYINRLRQPHISARAGFSNTDDLGLPVGVRMSSWQSSCSEVSFLILIRDYIFELVYIIGIMNTFAFKVQIS